MSRLLILLAALVAACGVLPQDTRVPIVWHKTAIPAAQFYAWETVDMRDQAGVDAMRKTCGLDVSYRAESRDLVKQRGGSCRYKWTEGTVPAGARSIATDKPARPGDTGRTCHILSTSSWAQAIWESTAYRDDEETTFTHEVGRHCGGKDGIVWDHQPVSVLAPDLVK